MMMMITMIKHNDDYKNDNNNVNNKDINNHI